jgi:hypothetical protein
VEWRDLTTKAVTARELYDYEVDPLEKRNVVDDPAHADLVARLARQLAVLRAVPGAGLGT